MNETIERDSTIMKRLSYVMLGFLLLMIACLVWICVQVFAWDWALEQTVPTFVLALVLWSIAMFAAAWLDRIKRNHDLITYHEILSFWNGEQVDRDTERGRRERERGRRERLIPRWLKIIRAAGFMILALAIGAFLGYGGAYLANMLLS